MSPKTANLVLEDGYALEGRTEGLNGAAFGEVVFTTNMTGYQEVLTDPSYAGQIVTFTYPLIGNYGILDAEDESFTPHARGLIVRELTSGVLAGRYPLKDYLAKHHIPYVEGIDTRALTRHIRMKGAMRGGFSDRMNREELLDAVKGQPQISDEDLVAGVMRKSPETYGTEGRTVVLLDYGVKQSIIKNLTERGMKVVVLPGTATVPEILNVKPEGVVLSNGPGDPKVIGYAHKTVRQLAGQLPIFGICLGHQIVALALGGDTYKLKFGHRGGNHPVIHLEDGHVTITTQNHGFSVDEKTLSGTGLRVTHRAVNDGTVEGLRHKEWPIFCVQYHPEGAPGPWDSHLLFKKFLGEIEKVAASERISE